MTQSLYRRMLGPDFSALPAKVRELHDIGTGATWSGRASVERGRSPIARLAARLAGLPPSAEDVPLVVSLTPDGTGEIWRRRFGDHIFQSHQRPGDGVILEKVGPATLHLRPSGGPDGLSLTLVGTEVFGVRIPSILLARVTTREHEQQGRYVFEVAADLPFVGLLVRYRGWLEKS